MKHKTVPLGKIAYARSGDKGSHANIGVIAYTEEGYRLLEKQLDEKVVANFFKALPITKVKKYRLPNLWALNFILEGVLGGGGSRSLRSDAQGKSLGQAILELCIEVPTDFVMEDHGK